MTLQRFAAEVRVAQTEARAANEIKLHQLNPAQWLKWAARGTPDQPRWSELPQPGKTEAPGSSFMERVHAMRVRQEAEAVAAARAATPQCSDLDCSCTYHKGRYDDELTRLRNSHSTEARIRDRVQGLIRVKAGELVPNPANWRRHPAHQRAALRGVLRQIGYADALLVRRDGDRLVLIDGHLRQALDPEQVVPVLVLDVDEAEAELLLATLDPLAALAVPDSGALAELLGRVEASSAAVRDLLADLARGAGLPVARLLADPDHLPEA